MPNNSSKGGGFLLIAVICGVIVALTLGGMLLREIAYQFKRNTGTAVFWTLAIGAVSYWIFRIKQQDDQ